VSKKRKLPRRDSVYKKTIAPGTALLQEDFVQ